MTRIPIGFWVPLAVMVSASFCPAVGGSSEIDGMRGPRGNLPPVAVPDHYATPQDTSLSISAPGLKSNDYDPDGDVFELTSFVQATHGSVTWILTSGAFTYLADPGFIGTDTFSYRLTDFLDLSASTTVTIDVYANPNRAPVGLPDAYGVLAGTTLSVAAPGLKSNDYDPDGDVFDLTSFVQATHGSAWILTSGAFSYQPDLGFVGLDSFRYWLRDEHSLISESTDVTLFVGVVPADVLFVDSFESGDTTRWGPGGTRSSPGRSGPPAAGRRR